MTIVTWKTIKNSTNIRLAIFRDTMLLCNSLTKSCAYGEYPTMSKLSKRKHSIT
jgi:hypothetical protein